MPKGFLPFSLVKLQRMKHAIFVTIRASLHGDWHTILEHCPTHETSLQSELITSDGQHDNLFAEVPYSR